MTRFPRWSGFAAVMALGLLVLFVTWGGAIHWNREPPYELIKSWGGKGDDRGHFNDPTGIAASGEEVFVADARNHRIQVFGPHGGFRRAFGDEVLARPMNLAIASDRLYVPDYFRDVVHVFSLGGEYHGAIEADDGLNSPGGVAVFPDGSLLVADTYGQRIVHLETDGTVLKSWIGTGIGASEFNYPTDVAIAPDGGFYVADGYNDRIQQFGPDGNFIRKWGGPFAVNLFGPFKGWFATVTSVAVGPDGSVYAADFYNNRIQKFSADGSFLTAFGNPVNGPGHSELAVTVASNGTVWTTHFAGNRVEKWERHR